MSRAENVAKTSASKSAARSARSVDYATSPLLNSPTPPWRSRLVVLLVGVVFAVLLGRAVYLQLWATDFYQQEGEKRFVHSEVLPASRGRILDRNGLALAASVSMPSVHVDTTTFAADVAQRKALAKLLGLSVSDFDDKLDGMTGTVAVRRHLDEAAWQQIKAMKLKGVFEKREYQRRYPEGEAAAHVVGFTNIDDKGIAGAEKAFQPKLLGQNGLRTVVRDRLGRVIENVGDPDQPDNGNDIHLSIDSRVQSLAWQKLRETVLEHGASTGSVVVLDSLTGEVLALANYPGFDPSNRAKLEGDKLRNIALVDTFEPGSTMKPLIAAMALESGRWTPQSSFDTAPGKMTITGATISDSHPHGVLTMNGVIQKSSNIGTVLMARQMPARDMWAMYTAVGLGQKPQIDFPGTASGRLRPAKTWRPIEHATMSYGYGLSTSLFQLARAYTVFARDGELMPVTLLRQDDAGGAGGAAGAATNAVAGQRVMSASTAKQVRHMLHLAASPGGTAPLAQEKSLGYSVGGKTGTVRMHAKGRGYTNKHRAFFVGLAPIESPRIVVAVMVAEPSKGKYYGGEVAAPLFGQVVQQTLRLMNVAPDMDVKAQVSAKPAVAEKESN
jgi:cell division protein FtsI (penicillin-binding protein 3)